MGFRFNTGDENMRILLADHRTRVRFALRTLLARQPGLEIVGEARGVENLIVQVAVTQPDLVLFDWDPGVEAVAHIPRVLRRIRPGLVIIALSGRPEARHAALAAGADAFVSKVDPPERLLSAVLSVGQDAIEEPALV
jgi:DNA-binding NarL/FixJ family response regulator